MQGVYNFIIRPAMPSIEKRYLKSFKIINSPVQGGILRFVSLFQILFMNDVGQIFIFHSPFSN